LDNYVAGGWLWLANYRRNAAAKSIVAVNQDVEGLELEIYGLPGAPQDHHEQRLFVLDDPCVFQIS
jgi:hypothetical protein